MGGLVRGIQPSSFKFLLLVLCLAFGSAHATTASNPLAVNIVVAEKASPQVKFGADEIRRALEPKGIKVTKSTRRSNGGIQVYLGQRGDSHLGGFTGNRQSVPDGPESYAISVVSPKNIIVEGSDATGAMYGALDAAEQFVWAKGNDLAALVKPVSKSPYLQLRGVNMFIVTQDIDKPDGAFWSDEYWTDYLDMMARNRYNLLDIHGPCDAVTLTFPNGFSYFVSLPDYPEVGVGPERAKRNMDRLHQVIRMAADRGIKVAYMNYEAPAPIGPWKTRRWMKDERWVPFQQDFLDGPRLEDYTRKAVTSFLKQLPELWMFGFRVGESGQPEDFYKKTYLAVLEDFPKELNLYVRTWIAYPNKVRELARSTKHHLYIEPKYNGEQLGSPYQAALGGRQYPPSGSYEDYTNYPRDYSILWQIRAHGTHRVFYWGSPEFARRTVRSCKFGDGVGFSMEPMEAYCPAADYLHNNPQTDHHFYKWMFERDWLWHLTWGRTAYDPEVPDQVWLSEFERRFDPQAGPLVFKAVVEGSKIAPFIYSYHNQGLDHQEFAPEFENGDHAFGGTWDLIWQGHRLLPGDGNNDDFLRIGPIDRTAMADPVTYVDARLRNLVSGKMTPWEAADYLGSAADASDAAIKEAARLNPSSPKEFDCIRADIEALGWLARYYRDRIRSVTHLQSYHCTYAHPELTQAHIDLERAVVDWDRLSDVTEQHFGYVPDTIRMGVNQFRWRDEGRGLGVDLEQLDQLEKVFRQLPRTDSYRTIIGHVPAAKIKPGQPLTVTATYASKSEHAEVSLFFRNSRESGYTKVPLKLENRFERTFTGEIPADKVVPGYLEYYFEADVGPFGPYGSTLEHRPPYHVLVNGNDSPPVISPAPPAGPVHASSVLLTVQAQAKAKLSSVRVYYKRTPAYYEWVRIEMQPRGGTSYSANVPLTPEGILYYFEAIDEDGNAANYPNFMERTPYLVVNAWDPSESAGTVKDPGRESTARQGQ
jgi:hypothetical protein